MNMRRNVGMGGSEAVQRNELVFGRFHKVVIFVMAALIVEVPLLTIGIVRRCQMLHERRGHPLTCRLRSAGWQPNVSEFEAARLRSVLV